MQELVELIYTPVAEWGSDDSGARVAFASTLRARYPRIAADLGDRRTSENRFQIRVNAETKEGAVPYAALIPPNQELAGPYGGMSFVLFPADDGDEPALLAMVVGTNGLAPDEEILGRPGHARKCAAIGKWLNRDAPGSAWAKHDAVRIDLDMPRATTGALARWSRSCARYGKLIYATFGPARARTAESDRRLTDALTALVDLFFDERRIEPKQAFAKDAERIRRAWLAHVLPETTRNDVVELLRMRRFVVLEGPPGTGKTEMARAILRDTYSGRGRLIQFHPGTTYETFIGGLAPERGGQFGFTFAPAPGHLMLAAIAAANDPDHRHLLVVDEINRADLAKVLGEAIYLFEPDEKDREVVLGHDFPDIGRTFRLPPTLDVLGTMNSADRSIAILDIAVRRRFAFVPLWPQLDVVERQHVHRFEQAFSDLVRIFVEQATDDAFVLLPGHAYFLGGGDRPDLRLRTGVRSLLEEYLAQGYVAGFADEIRAYIDRLDAYGD